MFYVATLEVPALDSTGNPTVYLYELPDKGGKLLGAGTLERAEDDTNEAHADVTSNAVKWLKKNYRLRVTSEWRRDSSSSGRYVTLAYS